MNKLYSTFLVLAMLITALGFSACGGDDTEPRTEIIGQWECTFANTTMYNLSTDEIMDDDYKITIFTEGTILVFYEDETCYTLYKGSKKYYTYKINGDVIVLDSHTTNNTYKFNISSGKLNLTSIITDSDKDVKFVCKAVFRKQ